MSLKDLRGHDTIKWRHDKMSERSFTHKTTRYSVWVRSKLLLILCHVAKPSGYLNLSLFREPSINVSYVGYCVWPSHQGIYIFLFPWPHSTNVCYIAYFVWSSHRGIYIFLFLELSPINVGYVTSCGQTIMVTIPFS